MEFLTYWPWVLALLALAITLIASIHVILYKHNPQSALAWIGIIWLGPFIGAFSYFLFGINRLQRRARRLRRRPRKPQPPASPGGDLPRREAPVLPAGAVHLLPLARLAETVTGEPLRDGHSVRPLYDGDEAYPEMLEAIDAAEQSIALCMYIFRNDETGRLFVSALGKAVARGVEVRVLIDDIGAHDFWNSIVKPLQEAKVPTARFMRRWIPRSFAYANLRNHRKMLIIDGQVGFCGGMNISEGHWLGRKPRCPIHDLHFRIQGPVVAQMLAVFAEDWRFTTDERLQGDRWAGRSQTTGTILARGVSSGPDEDLEKIHLVLLGAVSSANATVRIVTPYFLPDPGLISALNIAALRGVQVDIFLPATGDLRFVQWASMAQLPLVLEYGCRVWLTPPPFFHKKLMIVDGVWTMFGSANWDPRSLRLNFEYNVECYDRDLAAILEARIDEDLKRSERMTLTKWNHRSAIVKFRDGIAHLMAPLL
jgi:cardiolipin synthase A/B